MKIRPKQLYEPAVLFAIGVFILFISKYVIQSLPQDGEFFRPKIFNNIKHVSFSWSGIFFTGAMVSFLRSGNQGFFTQYLKDVITDIKKHLGETQLLSHFPGRNGAGFWLLIFVLLAGAFNRVYFAFDPIRLDEASTFVRAVFKPYYYTFRYYSPNNHLLHTQLAYASTMIFGISEFSSRLPALIAGIINLPLIFVLTRRLLGPGYGLTATAVIAVLPFSIIYDYVARGYSLVNMFFMMGLFVALSIMDKNTRGKSFILSAILALGAYTMPSFLFSAAGIMLWLTIVQIQQKQNIREVSLTILLPVGVMASLLTSLLYTPTLFISKLEKIYANPFVETLTWNGFIETLPVHLIRTAEQMSYGVHVPVLLLLGMLAMFGTIFLTREKTAKVALLFPSIFIGALIILTLKMAIPFPRTWAYLIPVLVILIDAGASTLFYKAPKQVKRAAAIVCAMAIGFAIFQITNQRLVSKHHHIGKFSDAEEFAIFLSNHAYEQDSFEGKALTVNTIKYYWHMHQCLPALNPDPDYKPKTYYILKKSWLNDPEFKSLKLNMIKETDLAIIGLVVDSTNFKTLE